MEVMLTLEPSQYTVEGIPDCRYIDPVTIQHRGNDRWAVCCGAGVLSKRAGIFLMEGLPSGRTEEHLDDTRYDSPEEALEALIAAMDNPDDITRRNIIWQQITARPHGPNGTWATLAKAPQ